MVMNAVRVTFGTTIYFKTLAMRKIFFSIFLFLSVISFAQVKVQNQLTENLSNPIGLDIAAPRFSWQLAGDKRNILQTAYEIKVVSGKSTAWNSRKVLSDQSVHVPYAGNALQSERKYQWQVRVWDNASKASAWSAPAFFQMAFLSKADWKAKWIEPGYTEDPVLRSSPLFRKTFSINKKIASATAYITAHGLYEAQLNGHRIGDAYLTPGWTSYKKRLQYQTYDVTDFIKTGKNAIGVTLGNGWYRGYLAWGGNHNIYGSDIALLLPLSITYS